MSELRFTPEMYDEGIRLATEDLREKLVAAEEKIALQESYRLNYEHAMKIDREYFEQQLAAKEEALEVERETNRDYFCHLVDSGYGESASRIERHRQIALAAIQAGKEQGE